MNKSAGPVIWVGILSSTCILLFLFQKILWLVIPFLLGLILYYLLSPIMSRLVLMGLTREMAVAITVGSFFLIVATFAIILFPFISTHILSWKDLMARYLEGGMTLLQKTLVLM